jgi:hypothetical protein
LAANFVTSPAEVSFAERSVEMTFPRFRERREDAVAAFVVLVNIITKEISGETGC